MTEPLISPPALLRPDETLTLGVNVIIRPGDLPGDLAARTRQRMYEHGIPAGMTGQEHGVSDPPGRVAPQEWVALIGNGRMSPPCERHRLAGMTNECLCPGRRIVPLYRGWDCIEDGHPDGYECPPECDQHPQVLVGRGSIEVVPVIHIDGTPLMDGLAIEILQTGRTWLVHVHKNRTADVLMPLTLDPLPVPGRDFGIVIDCVELA